MTPAKDRPVVFLDVDGVVNSPRNYHKWSEECCKDGTSGGTVIREVQAGRPEADRHVLSLFDPKNIAVLNSITDRSSADIVISSSWRLFYGEARLHELIEIFRQAGITAPVLGCTPTKQYQRGEGILAWLYANRPAGTRMLVLDDEGPWEFRLTARWLLRTDGSQGLVPKDLPKALRILAAAPYVTKP